LFPDLPVTITADSFVKQFPSVDKSNVYGQLKEAMNSLYNRSVMIHDIDSVTKKARIRETRWISEKAYIDGVGHVQIVFTPEVIKYMTRLETEFTSYQLEKVGNMTSAYAVRMYELLAQHRDIGTRTLNMAWLRETLQIAPDEYKLTTNFIRKVIEVAVDQINKHSDLTVSYKSIKTSRAITDFAFKIKNKDRKPKRQAVTDQEVRDQLEDRGQQRIDDPIEEF
jgi:plasmid replication initiation protein